MFNKNVVLVCVTAVVLGSMGILGWLVQTGNDPDRIVGWIGTIAGPLVLGLMTLLKTDRIEQRVEDVHANTNGTLTNLIDEVKELRQERSTGAN